MRCRDDPTDCVQATLDYAAAAARAGRESGSRRVGERFAGAGRSGAGHQAWMLNEFNPLVWPSPAGIGVVDPEAWQHTVDVLTRAGAIAAAPPGDAYRTDLAEDALAELADLDTTGAAFVKGTVEVTPGGQ